VASPDPTVRAEGEPLSVAVERNEIRLRRAVGGAPPAEPCPVCHSALTDPVLDAPPRGASAHGRYWQCARCWVVFLDPARRPTPHAEASHYALHDNRSDDPAYRRFLARIAGPVQQRVAVGSHGLDFGCGPLPVLAHMLREAGLRVTVHDPLFFPNDAALEARYDFIVLSEVAEHFHAPAREFERLFAMLRPGGLLAVMTGFAPPVTALERWHYRRDPTHVVFYRPATLRWLAEHHGADCEIAGADVALLRRRD
jgi:SAM-dependent methyltransferase